jgi:hypothetical protein
MASRSRGVSCLGILVVLWLLIGVLAAYQRDYFSGSNKPSCTTVSTIALTVVAGPLNYLGVNPKVTCKVPQPSQ